MTRASSSRGSGRGLDPVGCSRRGFGGAASWPGLCVGVILSAAVFPAEAEPHVVGYERFHSGEPSAAGGAILFSELGCASCHGGSDVVVPRTGPNLVNLRDRVERDWVAAFLRRPDDGRDGSTMPEMLHGLDDADREDLLAYLGSLGKGARLKKDRHANAELGSALYHEKGCVACHAPTEDYRGPHGRGDEFDDALAVAHPDLAAKTSFAALVDFLVAPSRYRVDGRMPHLPLDRQEAVDIAAHLVDFQASDPRETGDVRPWPGSDPEQISRGQALAKRLNCTACHDLPDLEPRPLRPLADGVGDDGCLSVEPIEGLPHYSLAEKQRESLRAFLAADSTGFEREGELTLAAMNCYACHQRDGIGGPTDVTDGFFHGEESLGDSGRLPPPLTGVGHKLRADWMESVFAGGEDSRVRPYLQVRMPHYRNHAEELTAWLQEIDASEEAGDLGEATGELAAGRKLLGVHGGVNCITCHHWGETRSLGIPGPDLSELDRRLRPDWFRDYLLDPSDYRPGTLMPPLWPGGRSTVPDILGGDAEKQIAAIWGFIRDGESVPEGFPDRSGRQFELVPEDRPIIQRTFLTGTGSKAILVGFPEGVHLAFDAASGKPSLAWRGRFFDAYNTWFTRAAPFEDPLGKDVVSFAGGGESRRYLGYRLDGEGNPTFLLREPGREIEESFRAADGALVRTVRWSGGVEPELSHPGELERRTSRAERSLTIRYTWK